MRLTEPTSDANGLAGSQECDATSRDLPAAGVAVVFPLWDEILDVLNHIRNAWTDQGSANLVFDPEATLRKKKEKPPSVALPKVDTHAVPPTNAEEAWNSRFAPGLFEVPGSDLTRFRVGDGTFISIGTKFHMTAENDRVQHPWDGLRGPGFFGRIGIALPF